MTLAALFSFRDVDDVGVLGFGCSSLFRDVARRSVGIAVFWGFFVSKCVSPRLSVLSILECSFQIKSPMR